MAKTSTSPSTKSALVTRVLYRLQGWTDKKALDWQDIRAIGRYALHWHPNNTYAEYFAGIRPPSRQFPRSYARAAQTQKFASWLRGNHPEQAKALGL